MYNLLDKIVSIWFGLMIVYFLCFLILGLFIYKRFSKIENHIKRTILKAIPIVFLFIIWIVGFGLAEILEYKSKKELLHFINDKSNSYEIIINGRRMYDVNIVVEELRKIKNIVPHSSHPINEIKISITNEKRQTMELVIGRDSDRKTEYWVYVPKYRHTSINEIGRLNTGIFDYY